MHGKSAQTSRHLLRNACQRQNRDFRKKTVQARITTHRCVVLRGLDELGEAIQRTFVVYCAIEPGNLNEMIRRMKENGRIKDVGEAVGPRVALKLTHRGKAVRQWFQKPDTAVTEEFFAPLTGKDVRTLRSALTMLVQPSRGLRGHSPERVRREGDADCWSLKIAGYGEYRIVDSHPTWRPQQVYGATQRKRNRSMKRLLISLMALPLSTYHS